MHKEILKLQEASFSEVKKFASLHWAAMQEVVPPSNYERLLVSHVAQRFEVKWPLKRMPEPIIYYARKKSPDEVCQTRSLGKQKAKALLILIMLAWDAIKDGDTEEDFAPVKKSKKPLGPPPATDLVETLNYHWEYMRQTLEGSTLSDEKLVDLARRWGIRFRSTMDRTLGDVLVYQNVQVYVEYAPKIGKTKIMPVTLIVRRACQELDPDGPFGPPPEGPQRKAAELLRKLGRDPQPQAITKLIAKQSKVRADRLDVTFRRYGLDLKNSSKNSQPKTLREVADVDGITRERVRQIQAAAESEIRDNLLCRELIRQVIRSRRGVILERMNHRVGEDRLPGEPSRRALNPLDVFCINIHYGSVEAFILDCAADPAFPLVYLRRDLFGSPADFVAFAELLPDIFVNPPGPYVVANPMAANPFLMQFGESDLKRSVRRAATDLGPSPASAKAAADAANAIEEDIAPGRSRAHDHEPTEADFDSLLVKAALQSYVEAKAFSTLPPPYRAWRPEMEYRWAVWAESACPEELFHSLLFVIEPDSWKQPEAVREDWTERKRRGGEYLLSPPTPNYNQGVRDFDSIFALTALALEQGGLQVGDLAMFFGWPAIFDPRAFATLAFLVGIGVLEPRRSRLGVHQPASGEGGAAAQLAEFAFVHWNGGAKEIKRIEKRFANRIAALENSAELGWLDVGELKAGK